MALLNKDQILKADDLPTVDIEVPEWGGMVRIKTMTGEQRDAFESSQVKFNKKGTPEQNLNNVRARLVVMVVIGDDGKPLFTTYDIADLGRKSSKALDRVYEKATEMNGFSEEDMENLAKDFGNAPAEGSTSDSP